MALSSETASLVVKQLQVSAIEIESLQRASAAQQQRIADLEAYLSSVDKEEQRLALIEATLDNLSSAAGAVASSSHNSYPGTGNTSADRYVQKSHAAAGAWAAAVTAARARLTLLLQVRQCTAPYPGDRIEERIDKVRLELASMENRAAHATSPSSISARTAHSRLADAKLLLKGARISLGMRGDLASAWVDAAEVAVQAAEKWVELATGAAAIPITGTVDGRSQGSYHEATVAAAAAAATTASSVEHLDEELDEIEHGDEHSGEFLGRYTDDGRSGRRSGIFLGPPTVEFSDFDDDDTPSAGNAECACTLAQPAAVSAAVATEAPLTPAAAAAAAWAAAVTATRALLEFRRSAAICNANQVDKATRALRTAEEAAAAHGRLGTEVEVGKAEAQQRHTDALALLKSAKSAVSSIATMPSTYSQRRAFVIEWERAASVAEDAARRWVELAEIEAEELTSNGS